MEVDHADEGWISGACWTNTLAFLPNRDKVTKLVLVNQGYSPRGGILDAIHKLKLTNLNTLKYGRHSKRTEYGMFGLRLLPDLQQLRDHHGIECLNFYDVGDCGISGTSAFEETDEILEGEIEHECNFKNVILPKYIEHWFQAELITWCTPFLLAMCCRNVRKLQCSLDALLTHSTGYLDALLLLDDEKYHGMYVLSAPDALKELSIEIEGLYDCEEGEDIKDRLISVVKCKVLETLRINVGNLTMSSLETLRIKVGHLTKSSVKQNVDFEVINNNVLFLQRSDFLIRLEQHLCLKSDQLETMEIDIDLSDNDDACNNEENMHAMLIKYVEHKLKESASTKDFHFVLRIRNMREMHIGVQRMMCMIDKADLGWRCGVYMSFDEDAESCPLMQTPSGWTRIYPIIGDGDHGGHQHFVR